MLDFQIRRGLSTELFLLDDNNTPNYEIPNPAVTLEEGYWYLCADTAELFLCVQLESGLTLKRINEVAIANRPSFAPSIDKESAIGVVGAYIDENTGELYLLFSDGTEESLGYVVGEDGKPGLVTSIKIGEDTYTHVNGLIELPSFATEEFVAEKVSDIKIPEVDLDGYVKTTDLEGLATETFVLTKIAEAELSDKDIDVSSLATKNDLIGLASTDFVLTEISKIELIPGEPGKDGADGKDGLTPHIGENGHWWIGTEDTNVVAQGKDGADGKDGQNGLDGTDGKDGIDGAPGQNGVGIEKIEKTCIEGLVDTYEITYTDGTKTTFTITNGANGVDGKDGKDGKDGISITDATIVDGRLVLTLSNGTVIDLGNIKGADGKDGADGEDGKDGIDGKDGVDGKTPYIQECYWYIDGVNTEVKAEGVDGKDGKNGIDGKDGQDYILTEQDKQDIANLAVVPDEIPFKTDKFVTTPIGGFKGDGSENVNGLTVAQLFAKLLGFTVSDPVEPELPSEPTAEEIIESIITKETPVYQITDDDQIIEVSYSLLSDIAPDSYTPDNYLTVNDNQTGFYQVEDDNGNILEAGYQHNTASKEPYYIVALPEYLEVTPTGNVQLQLWDTTAEPPKWVDALYILTSDYQEIVNTYNADGITPPSVPEGYKLWADLRTSDPGTSYRFIIKDKEIN